MYSHISEVYGEAITVPLKTLVQHLCTKVPDRAEYRSKMAAVSNNILSSYESLMGIHVKAVFRKWY